MNLNHKSPEEMRKDTAAEMTGMTLPFDSNLGGGLPIQMLVVIHGDANRYERTGDFLCEHASTFAYIAREQLKCNLHFIVTESRITTGNGVKCGYKVEVVIEGKEIPLSALQSISNRAMMLLANSLKTLSGCSVIVSLGSCVVFSA